MSLRRSFTCKSVSIPEPVKDISSDLALSIIEKENQTFKSPTPSLIQDLINCYSEAIEFYSSKNDLKYLDFQKRMHLLLADSKIIQVLTGKTPAVTSAREPFSGKMQEKNIKTLDSSNKNEQAIFRSPKAKAKTTENVSKPVSPPSPSITLSDPIQLKNKPASGDVSPVSTCPSLPSPNHQDRSNPSLRSAQIDHPFTFPAKLSRNTRIIVDRHETYTKETTAKAIKDFKSQDSALKHRLASRKKLMLTRSMTNSSFSRMDLSDIIEDEPISTNNDKGCFIIEEHPVEMDKFELKLEEIMERNFAQRAAKTAEIKLKYESQISEMAGMGDLMKMVVDQMRENMKKEIDEAVEEFDRKRREEIKALKESRIV